MAECNPTDLVSLREYVDTLFAAHHREHLQLDKALEKAEKSLLAKLEVMNEFRHQLDRQAETFATKDQLEPIKAFQARLVGIVLAVGALSSVVTALVMRLFGPG